MRSKIPAELRELPQWVCAGSNKLPINPKTGEMASVTDPSTWGTFYEACEAGMANVGFVLTAEAGFTIIDLDDKADRPLTPEQAARHRKILEAFDSYTEISTSGRGCHIVVRGTIPAGVHRDSVEVYSSGRYMICTGNVLKPVPIRNYQELLNIMCQEMKPPTMELHEADELLDDRRLFEIAMSASNADKFNSLCAGDMTGYSSQSEADFALLAILAYYSQSNEQVRRTFRMTALGKRDKAQRNDTYLNYALGKIRAQQPPPINPAQLIENANRAMMPPAPPPPAPPPTPEPAPDQNSWPPGLIGEIASYIYQTAVRPVPEVAVAAAIAFTAGVSGRSYNVSGTGLNQYIILLAKTGVGKEGAQSGIDRLITEVRRQVPMIDQFSGPGAFASGQALVKFLAEKPVFLSILGEFGLTLQQLSDYRANSAQVMLKKVLLDLYGKSGWHQTLRSSVYSDTEKNAKAVQAPCVSLLGESTPEAFFDGLDVSHIAEGLIPRFTIIEYVGERPERNRNAGIAPPASLVQRVADLATVALTTSNNGQCNTVEVDDHSTTLLDKFDDFAGRQMLGRKAEVDMQLWNRAHLKAIKLAALLAVGVNPHRPVVTRDLAQWAISFVRRDVEAILARFKTGDVGQGDNKQLVDLRAAIEGYFNTPSATAKQRFAQLNQARVIPYAFLVTRVASVASFRQDKLGATAALKRGLQTLVDSGALVELGKPVLLEKFGFSGVAYGVGKDWA